jgi:hypothetical protein
MKVVYITDVANKVSLNKKTQKQMNSQKNSKKINYNKKR